VTYAEFRDTHARWFAQADDLAKWSALYHLRADNVEDAEGYTHYWREDLTLFPDFVEVEFRVSKPGQNRHFHRIYVLHVPVDALDQPDARQRTLRFALESRFERPWAHVACEDFEALL
jgi:hypothetical protein